MELPDLPYQFIKIAQTTMAAALFVLAIVLAVFPTPPTTAKILMMISALTGSAAILFGIVIGPGSQTGYPAVSMTVFIWALLWSTIRSLKDVNAGRWKRAHDV